MGEPIDWGEAETRLVTLSKRRNARRYKVTYNRAGQPLYVAEWGNTGSRMNSGYSWSSIRTAMYPLEGKALAVVEAACEMPDSDTPTE
jgi:hypothetical protein